jgi:hypothetical protein
MKAAVSNRFPKWAGERGSFALAGGTTAKAVLDPGRRFTERKIGAVSKGTDESREAEEDN